MLADSSPVVVDPLAVVGPFAAVLVVQAQIVVGLQVEP